MPDAKRPSPPSESGRVQAPPGWKPWPWTEVNGRRVRIPWEAVPAHLTPCRKCGRLLPDADPGDVCGACFGSVGPEASAGSEVTNA